jgi:hypothetical protein
MGDAPKLKHAWVEVGDYERRTRRRSLAWLPEDERHHSGFDYSGRALNDGNRWEMASNSFTVLVTIPITSPGPQLLSRKKRKNRRQLSLSYNTYLISHLIRPGPPLTRLPKKPIVNEAG